MAVDKACMTAFQTTEAFKGRTFDSSAFSKEETLISASTTDNTIPLGGSSSSCSSSCVGSSDGVGCNGVGLVTLTVILKL